MGCAQAETFARLARCQTVLQSGKPANDVLLYWPIHDTWQTPAGLVMQFTVHDQNKWLWPTSFYAAAMELWTHGYTFDEVSDRGLANAGGSDGKIESWGRWYRAIVVPRCRLMPVETLKKLGDLARAGVPVLVQESLPRDVPGAGNLMTRRAQFEAIDKSSLKVTASIDSALDRAGVTREAMVDTGLRFCRVANDRGGHDYFIVNRGLSAGMRWLEHRPRFNHLFLKI